MKRLARFMQFHETSAPDDLGLFLYDLIEQIRTKWILILDPAARANGTESRWPQADWFKPEKENQQTPVMIGHPWGYAKPSDLLFQFEKWQRESGEVNGDAVMFSTQYTPEGDRVEYPTVAEWFCWIDMEWLKTIVPSVRKCFPNFEDTIHPVRFLHLCAMYQRQYVVTVDMKDHGWKHQFKRKSVLARLGLE